MDETKELIDPRFPDGLPDGCEGIFYDDPRIVGQQGGDPWNISLGRITNLWEKPSRVVGVEVFFLDYSVCLTAEQFKFLALRGLDMLGIDYTQIPMTPELPEEGERVATDGRTTTPDHVHMAAAKVRELIPYDEDFSGFDWNGQQGFEFRKAVIDLVGAIPTPSAEEAG